MSSDMLKRLEQGIRAAHEAGNQDHVRALGAEYRRLQTSMQQGEPQEKQTVFSSFGNAFRANVDPILEGMGTTAEVLGAEGLGQSLKDTTSMPKNYESASERFMNADEDGSFAWRHLPGAVGEQVGQFAGSIASRGLGAAGGAVVGSLAGPQGAVTGGAIGSFAGPAAFEAMQLLGPVAMERAKNDGREEVTMDDLKWAATTAAASGTLNALAPGAQGFIRRALLEGATEMAQSVVQQAGETAGTEAGLDVSGREALGEGIIGMGSAATVDASIAAAKGTVDGVNRVTGDALSRTDNRQFSDDEIRAARRLERAADGDRSVLGNVSDTGDGTAKGAANATLDSLRAEAQVIGLSLRRLARAKGDQEALINVNNVLRQIGKQSSTTPQADIDSLLNSFSETTDAQRLASLTRQVNTIQDFTKDSFRDMGGFSKITRRFDLTDKRSQMALGAFALAAGGSFATMGGAVFANRAAQVIDKLTNRRSRVKRFVDSALKDGRKVDPVSGKSANQAFEELKQTRAAEKAVSMLQMQQAQANARPALDQSKGQAKVENLAQRFRTEAFATEDIFQEGATVPANDPSPVIQGHYRWQQATGMAPTDTLAVLEQLQREGMVPEGTAQRFREDIGSFKKDSDTPNIQRMVRQRANPEYVPDFSDPKPELDPDRVLRKLDDAITRPTSSRHKQKALEGDRRYKRAVAEVEKASSSLNPDQYQMLYDLVESVNSPNMTRADRFSLVNDMLPIIFPKRTDRAKIEFWRKKLTPLSAIGNDYRIEREAEVPPEVQEDRAKDETLKERGKKVRKRKQKKVEDSVEAPVAETQPEVDLPTPQTTEDRALAKLKKERSNPVKEEPKQEAQEAKDAEYPQLPVENPNKGKKSKLDERVEERIAQYNYAIALATEEGPNLAEYVNALPRSTAGRVEELIYDFATDRLTVNQLAEAFSNRFDVPPVEAANIVNSVLAKMEAEGKIKRFKPFKSDKLKFDGKYATDAEGKSLEVLQIEFVDPNLKERVEVAKAIRQVEKMVPQQDPDWDYTPNRTVVGAFEALKDIPKERVDGTFTPLLDFINSLRNSRLGVSNRMLDQIEDALAGTGERRLGTIGEVLLPKTEGRRRDEGPMRTIAQLLFQVGRKGERGGTIRQEWKAGANGRVYSINGLAHTQAGDIMKGILRTPEKAPVGGEAGLNFVFHGIGNLLGFDKKSPYERRAAIFDNDMVDDLIKFANDPFGRSTMKKKDTEPTRIAEIVGNGEGFFQVLSAAHEVKSMVEWVRERHKDKSKLSNGQLLQDPEVRADLAENYETDFIVQLDASNNAYQIAGMVMGYADVLRATGMLPPEGAEGDPDFRQGADIYLDPAREITQRVPELNNLGLPDSKLRKIFKKPIGTFLYAAEYNSRKEAFRDELGTIAKGYGFVNEDGTPRIVGVDGNDGLIALPDEMLAGLKSEEGFTFSDVHFDINGDVKSEKPVRRRVVKDGDKYVTATAEGAGKFKKARRKFDSAEDAARTIFEENLYTRMNRELIRDMNVRYPGMRQYLNFSQTVSEIVKGKGRENVAVPTKDGMMLEYSFKQTPSFAAAPVEIDGKTVRLGVRTPDYKLAGRGLAAFMTHQNDAWALRETHRRLPDLKGFNPIHDSYGFHPSDAARGQETWVQVMQELGSDDYNLFIDLLKANGISIEEYVAAGGDPSFVLGRKGVSPVPARNIPTALS